MRRGLPPACALRAASPRSRRRASPDSEQSGPISGPALSISRAQRVAYSTWPIIIPAQHAAAFLKKREKEIKRFCLALRRLFIQKCFFLFQLLLGTVV
jgi:hypothetical protein